MNFQTTAFFYGSFILALIAGLLIYIYLKNKRSAPKIRNFIAQAEIFKPIILKDVSIKFDDINHYKTRSSPIGKCDLYLFDKFLVILRRQKFILKINFEPLVIKAKALSSAGFEDYPSYTLKKVLFNKFKTDEVTILSIDENRSHIKTELVLKRLTKEQVNELRYLENW